MALITDSLLPRIESSVLRIESLAPTEGEEESHREPHRESQREPRNKKEPQGLRGSLVFLITGGGGVIKLKNKSYINT